MAHSFSSVINKTWPGNGLLRHLETGSLAYQSNLNNRSMFPDQSNLFAVHQPTVYFAIWYTHTESLYHHPRILCSQRRYCNHS